MGFSLASPPPSSFKRMVTCRLQYVIVFMYSSTKACLVDGITYDAENRRLVKTYPAEGLRRDPQYIYLNLDLP